jgi:hypothetical protein
MKCVIGVTALLALTATSLAFAVGSPSMSGNRPSGITSIASTASGRCSKAEATTVVRRLRLGDPSVSSPVVFQVLCGAFAGPGSEAMVVSIFGPGNTGVTEWDVLRWTGNTWQVLLRRHQGAVLAAVGTDVKESVSIIRPGDSRCCPSGGTRSRVWHWNGSRFAVGPWILSAPKSSSLYGFFKTPSGNILCGYSRNKGSGQVDCVVKSGLRPPGPRRRAGCTRAIVVGLRATGSVDIWGSICPGEDAPETPYVGGDIAWTLGYGEAMSIGGVRCPSAATGLTCRNKSGHGFFLSRDRWRAF